MTVVSMIYQAIWNMQWVTVNPPMMKWFSRSRKKIQFESRGVHKPNFSLYEINFMKIFILFIILSSVISCSTDNQNEDDVNYLSSYSDNENGDTDNNDGDSDNNDQIQDSENDSEDSVIVEKTFIVSIQKKGY